MTAADRLAKLFQSIAGRDWSRADAIALEICTDSDEKGHHGMARRLRGALRPNGRSMDNGRKQHVSSPDEFVNPLAALKPLTRAVRLDDVVLKPRWRGELEQFIREWRCREVLRKKGLSARTKLFFHGPPGCGKSLTAMALGHELSLPVYVVRFDAVIGAYLGQTAVHLRQLFHFAEVTPCVLLLDELDALGKRRGSPLDVGELDRIVISLMQELEHADPAGAVVATSNLPQHLDDALWRRFDLVVEFPCPAKRELCTFGRAIAAKFGLRLGTPLTRRVVAAKSFAEAETLIESEARRGIIQSIEAENGRATP